MFVLTTVQEKVKIAPDQFKRSTAEVIMEQIDIKFANRVIPDVGLCICFYDFLDVGDPYIYPGEGSAIQDVKFRLIIFKPFIGEIMTGRLVESRQDGLRVSVDFFDDINIPFLFLAQPSVFDEVKEIWTWKYGEEENSENAFLMELGETVRFKVRSVNFVGAEKKHTDPKLKSSNDSETQPPSAMEITGSTNDFGLGLVSWW
jgi:DNA-directed RNA polymerase III subunit RPC8